MKRFTCFAKIFNLLVVFVLVVVSLIYRCYIFFFVFLLTPEFYDIYIGLRTYMKESDVSHAYVICNSLPVIFIH